MPIRIRDFEQRKRPIELAALFFGYFLLCKQKKVT
jgi:hypothetical protein